nr:hypothetical protein [Tanacetum cinerariifolium]
IKREYSNARTPQQNRVTKRKNMTLIEAARTMLADLYLPNTFWAEVVSTACCVLNRPVTVENKANKTAGPKEANNSAEEKNGDQKLNGDTGSKTNKEPVNQDDQSFLEELEKLKRQAKDADNAAKTLRKMVTQDTEDLLLQVGAARARSTNYVNTASTTVNTASTPVNTASTPVNTASPSRNVSVDRPSYLDLLIYANQDDSQILSLGDIYEVSNDGIFTSASYDVEGVVADFTNLESTINGHGQEESIDYDEVFAPVARIEAIRIFLAFSSYIGFIVYQMDMKSALLYGKNDEEVYVSQPLGFIDPKFPKKVTPKTSHLHAVKRIFRYLKGQPKLGIWYPRESAFDLEAYSDSNYAEANLDKKSTTIEYVAAANCCGQVLWIQNQIFQVTPKTSHLHAVKRIFRYLKGQPKLGIWYPRDSAFDLEAYSDSNYAKANLDRKSTTIVGEGDDYAMNEGMSTDKIKVLNVEAEGVSAAGETLSTATLVVSTARSMMKRMSKRQKTNADLEEEEKLRVFLNIIHDEEREVDYAVLDKRIKKLEKRCKPSISHHIAWLRSVSVLSKKKKLSKREFVSKQGRKNAKSRPTKDDSAKIDAELDEDMEYMDTEEAVYEGRQSIVDTARPDVSTARQELSTAGLTTPLTTTTIFDDEEMTLADTLIKLKDDKAKEVERERKREEQASIDCIANLYDEVQARIYADHELAIRLTHEEHEKYIVVERTKLFAEYFERRKKQLAEERADAIRNKPPTKTQLRMLMMTYLKNKGWFTHSQLNKKSFKDIQGLYMKEQELIIDFVLIRFEEDQRRIRDINKKAEEESSDKEEEKLRVFLNIIHDEAREVDYAVLDKRMLKITKYQMSLSSSKSRLENNKVFGYILQVLDQNIQEEVKGSGLEYMRDVTFKQIMDEYDQQYKTGQEVPESPYDTESKIKIIKRFQPYQPTDDDQITFLGSKPFDMEIDQTTKKADSYEIDYVLQSMPDDDLASLSGFEAEDSDDEGFEAEDSDDEGSQSNHQDNLSKESTVGTLNASDDMPAQSDPLGHLQKELRTLNTKFNQLESSISKKVTIDI